MSSVNELAYYVALRRIWLRRNSEKQYGLSYEEALEMAYENIRDEACAAIRGKRAPKPATHKEPSTAPAAQNL